MAGVCYSSAGVGKFSSWHKEVIYETCETGLHRLGEHRYLKVSLCSVLFFVYKLQSIHQLGIIRLEKWYREEILLLLLFCLLQVFKIIERRFHLSKSNYHFITINFLCKSLYSIFVVLSFSLLISAYYVLPPFFYLYPRTLSHAPMY